MDQQQRGWREPEDRSEGVSFLAFLLSGTFRLLLWFHLKRLPIDFVIVEQNAFASVCSSLIFMEPNSRICFDEVDVDFMAEELTDVVHAVPGQG